MQGEQRKRRKVIKETLLDNFPEQKHQSFHTGSPLTASDNKGKFTPRSTVEKFLNTKVKEKILKAFKI